MACRIGSESFSMCCSRDAEDTRWTRNGAVVPATVGFAVDRTTGIHLQRAQIQYGDAKMPRSRRRRKKKRRRRR